MIQNIHKVWDDDDSVPRPSDIPNTKKSNQKNKWENEDEYLKKLKRTVSAKRIRNIDCS